MDTTDKENIMVYRYYDNEAATMSSNSSDEEYYSTTDDYVSIYTNKFPTYAIGYDFVKNPSDETCVRIVATYDEFGALKDVEITEDVPVSEAIPKTEGNVKTMYWSSLKDMQPVSATSIE